VSHPYVVIQEWKIVLRVSTSTKSFSNGQIRSPRLYSELETKSHEHIRYVVASLRQSARQEPLAAAQEGVDHGSD
jgi:predicted alpha/beta-fold hydrolase